MATLILFRAADSDSIGDCASFAETLETARAYLSNPGFGGRSLYSAECEIDDSSVLDLVDATDPVAVIAETIGKAHPGAIGADEYAPRVSYEIRDAGYDWVRVSESFPAGTVTWIFVGGLDVEPNLVEVAP
ncbi:MAG TPA: hypothetical protein VGK73_25200 [Polyangiaceae bacterium]